MRARRLSLVDFAQDQLEPDDFAEEPRAELLSVLSTLQQLYLDAYLAYRSFQQEYSAALRRYAYGHGLPRYWHLR